MSALVVSFTFLAAIALLSWISGSRHDRDRADRLRRLREEREKAARWQARRGVAPRTPGRAS